MCCNALVPPLRGLLSEAKLGVVAKSNFTERTVQLQTCNNPHRFAEPPERGHEGAFYK